MNRESQLIGRIRRTFPSGAGENLRLGIGDDAAVIRSSRKQDWVVSCDAFLENVHFLRRVHSPAVVGYKSLARAASDLAAMGARPQFFLLTLALPASLTGKWLDMFLRGMRRASRRFRLTLAGGDTSRQEHIGISITVIGETQGGFAVPRSGARPGDAIFVSGTLGAAQLGLELILRDLWRERRWKLLLRPHFYPPLRLDLGQWLARRRLASAMIDTSDGLSTDLAHLCAASNVGAEVWSEHIPCVQVPQALQERALSAERLALHGGEDYELLFTVPRRVAGKIPRAFRGVRISRIGEITRESKICLIAPNGQVSALRPFGWDHFR